MKITRPQDHTLTDAKDFVNQSLGIGVLQQFQKIRAGKEEYERLVELKKQKQYEDQDEIDRQGDREEALKALSKVKDREGLFNYVRDFCVPKDLDDILAPTDQWLDQMAQDNASNLLSFHHKKRIVEEIQDSINKEIERKKLVVDLSNKLNRFNHYVDKLDQECLNIFEKGDSNADRAAKHPLLRQLQYCYQTEPDKADDLIRSKAADYVIEIGLEDTHSHTDTLKKWHEPWDDNLSFEQRIMGEQKGYELEMKYLKSHFKLKYKALVEKTAFHIEAQERTLNDLKLKYRREIENLEMRIADYQSEDLRKVSRRTGQGSQQHHDTLENFLSNRPNNLRDALNMTDKVKAAVRGMMSQNEHMLKKVQVSERES